LVTELVTLLVTELVTELPVAGGARGCPEHSKAVRLQRVVRGWLSPRSGYRVDRPLRRSGLSMAGTLVAGTMVAGTMVAGTMVAGTMVAGTMVAVLSAVGAPQPALRQSAVFHELQPPAGWWGIDR
jgi:hypothetical protein